ncbi:hypothetical protein EPUS_00744 [Endocarpon pusillum Z07020]|uniref:Alpha/beta hydrolase fold-3 domain-containing protein n=1 Tax=Endocarpon pusillum (strain Z07020 / HMAS-L-300199) TaxID=1263415 RepID=U1HYN0_ENDPU|nr:uncharacterized protein EPUS_00744 [Endocarpon pusillum Z07020]ERF74614.1 hypothetical protein EPUS_00744 [Endocarpon pusillum Z07020]
MASSKPLTAQQPMKTFYIILFALCSVIRVPFLLLYYLPRSLRPRLTWSYRAAVGTALVRIYFTFITSIRLSTPRSLVPGADESRFELLQPGPTNVYRGVLQQNPAIRPTTLGCIWLPRLPSLSTLSSSSSSSTSSSWSSSRMILHFHGGAYVCTSPRLPVAQYGPSMLCSSLSATAVLLPQYRLASSSAAAFPAALQDAVTAYAHLLTVGVPPSRIIVSGDSAGAHLALALMRYLAENNSSGLLPLPAAVLLHSPWLDMLLPPTTTSVDQATGDYLPLSLLEWGVTSVVPPEEDAAGPYFSPLRHPFRIGVPLWVQSGTAELFYADAEKFVERMRIEEKKEEGGGSEIEFYRFPDGMHNTFAAAGVMGLEAEAKSALEGARKFVKTWCPSWR